MSHRHFSPWSRSRYSRLVSHFVNLVSNSLSSLIYPLVYLLSILMDHPLWSLSRSYVQAFSLSARVNRKKGKWVELAEYRSPLLPWFGIIYRCWVLRAPSPLPPSFCSVARARTTENQSCPFFLNSNGPSLSRTSSSRDIDLKKEKDQGKSDISRNFSSKLNFTLGDREFAMSFLCFPFFFFF